MKILYIIFFIVPVAIVCGTDEKQLWEKFKLDYNRTYDTADEERHRFEIFKDNLKIVHGHNERYEQGLATYLMEINKFGDLTEKEYCTKYKMYPNKTFVYNDTLPAANEIGHGEDNGTDYLDWREKGAVTPAKNQGTCGACWIFSAIGLLEGLYFRKYNKLISFSEQNIIDCISNTSCMGGWPAKVLNYVDENGAIREEEYRYQEKQGQCHQKDFHTIKIPMENAVPVKNDETKLKEAVTEFGPLIVCVYASGSWRFYKSGVWYERECSSHSNHAMLLVGYGRENGTDYWLTKNSMGQDWGENGFIKIARSKHHNYCGITASAFYVE